ncbi:MAG: hypothetical protein KJ732_06955 [Candidatus Margulisbacteria bacterium]|nr:hypothetical protein [Candidatus Margulisiibacteriota bacterium]
MIKNTCVFLLYCLLASVTFAADLSPEVSVEKSLTLPTLLEKIQTNQKKINDMYAETTTTIKSNISMPGSTDKGSQTMVQKGKMWTKGKDKSKIEMLSPTKQITITNGDQMAIINPETGQKMIQDLKKLKGQGAGGKGQGEMDLAKAMEYFDLSVKQLEDGNYVITGKPKEVNRFLTKMEFYVDSTRWVPVKILMYGQKDKLMSQSEIEYKAFDVGEDDQAYLPIKNISNVNTPMGKMSVEMEFGNIKVNKGIGDKEFEIK